MKSIDIWTNRYYNKNGNSGLGSTGELAKFKIDFINNFIKENDINSILDFGCGDCFIASQLKVSRYTGIDISDAYFDRIVDFVADNKELIKKPFNEIRDFEFYDCVICLDVLYHILEEETEYLYETLDEIYNHSNKYIIIYAQDSYLNFNYESHMFDSRWRQYIEKKQLKLIYEQNECMPGTSAKFFVYKKY
jgi:2-polyprenyl-3-methyl-5-hydroxy-6-metoxy-1,4-benzoquinol methylase